MELFERYGLAFALRWAHVLAGILWIGLLYYFNLVQVPALAEIDDAGARNRAIDKIARRALFWFRWAALATFVFGLLITGAIENYYDGFFDRAGGPAILMGMTLGTVMFLNVWGVIWRKQKIVLANANGVLSGREADPAAAPSGRAALLASRQNFIFSFAMLFFMVGTSHFFNGSGFENDLSAGNAWAFLLIGFAIILVLELNALGIFGMAPKAWNVRMYESHTAAIIAAFVLLVVYWLLSEIFLTL